jgi:Na+/melibiose symporter-like transporter
MAIHSKTNSVVAAAICSFGIFAFVFLVMGRIDSALATPRRWVLNLFTWLPSETSWNLGNLVFALLFGIICAAILGIPTGRFIGERKVASWVTLIILLAAAALMSWLAPLDQWSLLLFAVIVCVTPVIAWLSSPRGGDHDP